MYNVSKSSTSKSITSKAVYAEGDLKAHEIRRMEIVEDDLPSRLNLVGYVDPNKRIKQMIEAGIRIDAWNEAVYDFENEEMDDGVSMAYEREDWDDLDMLTEAQKERETYHREMYRMYRQALENEAKSKMPVDVESETKSESPQESDEGV